MKTLLMISLSSLLAVFWNNLSGQQTTTTTSFLSTLQSDVTDEMQKQGIQGMTLALVKNGEVVHIQPFGFADRDYRIPTDVHTTYRIASISKTITALAVLHAAERGLIDLGAPVHDYVPEYPQKGDTPITIEQLLACEGGLQQYAQTAPYNLEEQILYIREHPADYDPVAAVRIFADQPLLAAPGTIFNYSTFSFNLLGAVLERAAGMPYEQYIDTHIRKPLGMPFLQPEFRASRPYPQQAAWYRVDGDTVISDKGTGFDYEDVSWKLPGGGYVATAMDVALLCRGILRNQILSKESTQQLFTVRELNGKPTWYGLGLFLNKQRGQLMASQFGHQAGARSLIYLSPATKDAVILLSNTYGTDLLPLGKKIMDGLSAVNEPLPPFQFSYPETLDAPVPVLTDKEQKHNVLRLQWDPVPFAYQYRVEWDTSSSFSAPQRIRSVEMPRVAIPDLPFQKEIFFRVRAENPYLFSGVTGSWSAITSVRTGKHPPGVKLPYIQEFDGPPFIYMGDTVFRYSNGVKWMLDRTDAGMRIRGGRASLAPTGGGWTLDVFQGADRASGYLIMQCCLADLVADSLVLSTDLLFHGAPEEHPQLLVWVRGGPYDPWVYIPDAVDIQNGKGSIRKNILRILSDNGQELTHEVQVRWGFYGDNHAMSLVPQPAVTFLRCSLTSE